MLGFLTQPPKQGDVRLLLDSNRQPFTRRADVRF